MKIEKTIALIILSLLVAWGAIELFNFVSPIFSLLLIVAYVYAIIKYFNKQAANLSDDFFKVPDIK